MPEGFLEGILVMVIVFFFPSYIKASSQRAPLTPLASLCRLYSPVPSDGDAHTRYQAPSEDADSPRSMLSTVPPSCTPQLYAPANTDRARGTSSFRES